MKAYTKFAPMICRKCCAKNPIVYFAPVTGNRDGVTTVICLPCAEDRGWVDSRTGNLKSGVQL